MQEIQADRAGMQYDYVDFNAMRKNEFEKTFCVVADTATRGCMVQSS